MPTLSGNSYLAAKEFAPMAFPPIAFVEIDIYNGFGTTLYLCSRAQPGLKSVVWNGNTYECRISAHRPGQLQSADAQGIAIVGQYEVDLADADYEFFAIEDQWGFQGATMTVTLTVWDPDTNTFSTDSSIRFTGLCNPAVRKGPILTVSAQANLDLSRKIFPDRPVQLTCPWNFPTTYAERIDACNNTLGAFFQCGYSPDVGGGTGNYQSGSTPYTDCDKSKASCVARGMYSHDSSSRATSRFGGSQWMPPSTWKGKSYTEGKTTQGINSVNLQKLQEYVPETYGTTWVNGVVCNVVGDPNSTRCEVIISNGEYASSANDLESVGVQTVLVNNLLVPFSDKTSDLLFRTYLMTHGDRNGSINNTAIYAGTGDPYGSTGTIMPVVYAQVQSSSSAPSVQVLVGPRVIPVFTDEVTWTFQRTDLTAWVLLELYRRAGIPYSSWEINSVIYAASICAGSVSYTALDGSTKSHRRYGVSVSFERPTAFNTIVAGVADAARIMVVPNAAGTRLRMFVKQTLASQQFAPVPGSNDSTGYPSYLATDDPTGSPSGTGYFAYWFNETNINVGTISLNQSRIAQTPNVLAANIQDEDNDWTPDTVQYGDDVAYQRLGNQKIQATLGGLGFPNYDQAHRALATKAFELYRGNPRGDSGGTWQITFECSYRCAHLNQGDIVSLTFAPMSLDKQPFRVIARQDGSNFETSTITLQWHDDRAYTDGYGQKTSPYFNANGDLGGIRAPYPWQANAVGNIASDHIYGTAAHLANLFRTFDLEAGADELPDNSVAPEMVISGTLPVNKVSTSGAAPRIAMQGTSTLSSGTIPDGTTVYAYISALDASGNESPLQINPCVIHCPGGFNTNAAFVPVYQWPTGTTGYRIYAGTAPQSMCLLGSGTGTTSTVGIGSLGVGGAPPVDTHFDHFVLRAKKIIQAGYALLGPGLSQFTLAANTVTSFRITFPMVINLRDGVGTAYTLANNELQNYTIIAVYEQGGGDVPFIALEVTGNTGNILDCFVVSPDNLSTLNLSQIWFLAVRKVTGDSGISIQFADSGTDTTNWSGNLLRVIAGTGASNAPRKIIAGNTTGGIALDSPFETALDSTSICIIEEPSWAIVAPQPSVNNTNTGASATIRAIFDNLAGQFWYVQVSSSDAHGTEVAESLRPARIFYWQGAQPGQSLQQGLNLIPNPDLSIPGRPGTGEIIGGWVPVANENNAYQIDCTNTSVIYSGSNSFRMIYNGYSQSIAANSSAALASIQNNTQYPTPKPGEQYFGEMAAYYASSWSIPAGIEWIFFFRMVVTYTDGTNDQAAAGGPFNQYATWEKSGAFLRVSNSKTPNGLYTVFGAYMANTTGSPITVYPPGQSAFIFTGGLNFVRCVDVGTEAVAATSGWATQQGSLLPSQYVPISISTSNDGSGNCTIAMSWSAISLERSDYTPSNQSLLTVAGGSFTWTSLGVAEYYIYPYIETSADGTTGTIHIASGDPPTSPPLSPSQDLAIAQQYDGRYPQPMFSVTTPASAGTGGGVSGGGNSCPEAGNLVYVAERGVIPVGNVKVGDYIRGKNWSTGEAIFRKVKQVRFRASNTWRNVNGHRVSPMHPVSLPDRKLWQHADRIGALDTDSGIRVHITLDLARHQYDDQNYALVNESGEDSLIMHNEYIQPC